MSNILKYNNLLCNNPIIINEDWSRSGDKESTQMHSIASYLAMFAPALPKFFIKKLTQPGDLVMDPFSGRGTSALKARELGRNFVGSDLNPYALVLSRAKVSKISKDSIIKRIIELEKEFLIWKQTNNALYRRKQFEELRIYYAPKVLTELIFLRDTLGKQWQKNTEIDNAVLAFSLGLMHGPERKNGTSIYFSLSMSNSVSMSPNYVKKFAREKGLKRPSKSIFEKICNRVEKKYNDILNKKFDGLIMEHDATTINHKIKDESIDLVVTSPPYLSVVNYTNSNWLKLWLLGYERKTLKKDIELSDTLKYNEYITFITDVLNSLYPKLKPGASVCLIVGDVRETKLIESVWKKISNDVNYEFVEVYYDHGYSQNKKVLNTMNKRKGKATMIEKVLVVRKR